MTEYTVPIEFFNDDKVPDWLEVSIIAPPHLFPLLENFFHLTTPCGVVRYSEQGLISDCAQAFVARIPYSTDPDDVLKKLDAYLGLLEDKYCLDTSISLETRYLHDGRDVFTAFQVSPRFTVIPKWEDISLPDDTVIRLNPGRVFGTGQHPSTLLCLRVLEEIGDKGFFADSPTVLDVGTGTGILSIAAAKLGSGAVLALEVDEEAAGIAGENVSLNRLEHRIEVSLTPLSKIEGCFRLITANLTASVALYLADDICRRLMPDGFLILSGIRHAQSEAMSARYTGRNLKPVKLYRDGSWAGCLFLNSGGG
ncbi:MAG: 50S ribosomal protein L11 methyltransferase [Thermodesulfobacteriota bacterium]